MSSSLFPCEENIPTHFKIVAGTPSAKRIQRKNTSDTGEEIKWRCAGHIVRLHDNRWAHTMKWDLRSDSRRPVD